MYLMVMKESMGKELRRYQNRMVTCGMGIISFGIWAMIRSTAAFMTADRVFIKELTDSGLNVTEIRITGGIIIALIYSLVMALYGYIGLRAIAEGKGKKPKKAYLVAASLLFIWSVFDVYGNCQTLLRKIVNSHGTSEQEILINNDVTIASLVVSVTFALIMAELLLSAYRVKKLMKMNPESGGAA